MLYQFDTLIFALYNYTDADETDVQMCFDICEKYHNGQIQYDDALKFVNECKAKYHITEEIWREAADAADEFSEANDYKFVYINNNTNNLKTTTK